MALHNLQRIEKQMFGTSITNAIKMLKDGIILVLHCLKDSVVVKLQFLLECAMRCPFVNDTSDAHINSHCNLAEQMNS